MENIKIKRTGAERTIEFREKKGVGYFVFPRIEELGIVDHLFSTRLGGVSKGCYSTMNLSYTRGDEKGAVDENYCRISEVLGHGHSLDDFVSTFQTHTTNVRVVTTKDKGKGPLLPACGPPSSGQNPIWVPGTSPERPRTGGCAGGCAQFGSPNCPRTPAPSYPGSRPGSLPRRFPPSLRTEGKHAFP